MASLRYMAGFVDGEGCIGFAKCRSSLYPQVVVVNTNREILEQFKKRFGGDIRPLSKRKSNWKIAYSWRVNWQKAVSFIDAIYPYLIIKTAQAELVFAWAAIKEGTSKRTRFDQDHKDTLDFINSRSKWLNKRGVNNEIDPLIPLLERFGYAS